MKMTGYVTLKKGGSGFAKAMKAGEFTALEALKIATLEVHGAAIRGIMKVSSGELQVRYSGPFGTDKKGTKRLRVASKPGDPPNIDFGIFVKSVQYGVDESSLTAVVGSNDPRGPHFEFGTKNMAARPWLSVAWRSSQKKIRTLFAALKFKVN